MTEKRIYPVILYPEDVGFTVNIPDINRENGGVWTQGDTRKEALDMATEAAKLFLEDSDNYPTPSKSINTEDGESIGYITLVRSEKKVRKNVVIPEYLAQRGKEDNINFSKILTEALESRYSTIK